MSPFGRAGLIFLGYLAAVFVAVGVTVVPWSLLASSFGDGADSIVADEIASIGFMGLMVTFPTALPGFLVAVQLARKRRWTGWLRYALAGAVNVAPSLLIFSLYAGTPFLIPTGLMMMCLPGGFAGGAAYWLVAGQRIGRAVS